MKILVIDHLATQKANRHLYHCLAQYQDIELTLLVPEYWRENYSDIKTDVDEPNDKIKLRVGKNIFKGRPHMMLFYTALLRCVRERPDIIYVNAEPENFLMAQVVLLCKLFSPATKIVFVTWRNIEYTWSTFPYRLSCLHALSEKISFKYAHACRSFNIDGMYHLKKAGFNKEINLIPWGVDLDFFKRKNSGDLRKKYRLAPFVIGYMGRFVAPKGIDILIEALTHMKHLPFSLVLLGNGPEKENLKRLIEDSILRDRVVIIETVGYHDVPDYLSCMDILVLPSRTTSTWKEQFGRVLIEAMACEVVVIGSDSGEIPNVIGNAGLIFKEGEVKDLLNKIERVVLSSGLQEELIKMGIDRVRNIFSWTKIAADMHMMFKTVITRKSV